MEKLEIQPVSGPVDGDVTVPGSKSITNRALILAAMADGRSRLTGALFSEDTRYMAAALQQLGIPVTVDEETYTLEVAGAGGRAPSVEADLFIGNSGTSARFLTALVAAGQGSYRVDGVPRMRQRPIEDLLAALRQLDVKADSEGGDGCPPIRIVTTGIRAGQVRLRGDISSQYLTGLLMASPLADGEIVVEIEGDLASKPYVDITTRMMEQWGVLVTNAGYTRFVVPAGQAYFAQDYTIEPDASSASYFFAAAAVTRGRVRVHGLTRDALQGDVAFVDVLAEMGCQVRGGVDHIEVCGGKLRGVDVDMNGISDTVMTLAAIAPFASSPTTIRNVGHVRHKETDRLHAVATELRKLGVSVDEWDDGLRIEPCAAPRRAEVATYDDHRMAMSFAITGLASPGVTILDPGCVAKTFPDFFARLERLAPGAVPKI